MKHDWLNINTGKHGHGLVQGLMGVWMNHSMFFFLFSVVVHPHSSTFFLQSMIWVQSNRIVSQVLSIESLLTD